MKHNTPADLRREMDQLRREVRQLQTNNRLAASTIRGGTLLFQEESGTTRLALGKTKFDGTLGDTSEGYGVFEYDSTGALLAGADEVRRGIMWPPIEVPMHAAEVRSTTSSTFDGLWEGGIADTCHEVIFIAAAVQSSADTTGQVRIHGIDQDANTIPLTIPAGTNGFFSFEWLHPYTVGAFDSRSDRAAQADVLQIQARRTAGTGSIFVFGPRHFVLTSTWLQPGATTGGHGVLS